MCYMSNMPLVTSILVSVRQMCMPLLHKYPTSESLCTSLYASLHTYLCQRMYAHVSMHAYLSRCIQHLILSAQVTSLRSPYVQDFHVTRANKRVVREQCYGPQDLRLGAFIHVYGRDFFLHDADDFTKHWYSVRGPAVFFCCLLLLALCWFCQLSSRAVFFCFLPCCLLPPPVLLSSSALMHGPSEQKNHMVGPMLRYASYQVSQSGKLTPLQCLPGL